MSLCLTDIKSTIILLVYRKFIQISFRILCCLLVKYNLIGTVTILLILWPLNAISYTAYAIFRGGIGACLLSFIGHTMDSSEKIDFIREKRRQRIGGK